MVWHETEDLESSYLCLYYERTPVIDTQPSRTIKFRARFSVSRSSLQEGGFGERSRAGRGVADLGITSVNYDLYELIAKGRRPL